MTVVVELFARARDIAGQARLEMTVADQARVRDLRQAISNDHNNLRELLQKSAIAVNEAYAADDQVLRAGDHVAVLPPVSGG